MSYNKILACIIFFLISNFSLIADDSQQDIFSMTIEQLRDIEVTSASKREQKLADVAASLFVITQNDIVRSGATSIPEALRMVPGLHVARLNNYQWAISSRGFNSQFSDKLLVMIDGRTVYNPIFSGTYWNAQDTLLEDIERIEVIRGPGATIWGSNAVNGVINIITKNANSTKGGVVILGAGSEERAFAGVRYGEKLSDTSAIRVYAKGFDRDSSEQVQGGDSFDNWQAGQGGFRLDGGADNDSKYTIQGDTYGGQAQSSLNVPVLTDPFTKIDRKKGPYGGSNILGRVHSKWSESFESETQAYLDYAYRSDSTLNQSVTTYDLDTTHFWTQSTNAKLIFGIGYRLIEDDLRATQDFLVNFNPDTRKQHIFNGFVQEDIELISNKLTLSFGSKYEYNSVGTDAFQPSVRTLWRINEGNALWLASSRVRRLPSRIDRDLHLSLSAFQTETGLPGLIQLQGNKSFSGESAYVQELGYRITPNKKLSLDTSLFYSHFDRVRSFEAASSQPAISPSGQSYIPITNVFDTKKAVDSYGIELLTTADLYKWWKLKAWYTLTKLITDQSNSTETVAGPENEDLPEQQAFLRSSFDLGYNLFLDTQARFVDQLSVGVDSYVAVDLRLAWQPKNNWEFALVGQNLFDSGHSEFEDALNAASNSEIERSFYAQLKYYFE